jgi:hypothetical protein
MPNQFSHSLKFPPQFSRDTFYDKRRDYFGAKFQDFLHAIFERSQPIFLDALLAKLGLSRI